MKLVRRDAETSALQEWLNARTDDPVVTSELARVEVLRAARRAGNQALGAARALVGELDLVALDRTVHDIAIDVGGPMLRTLDALHLASAMVLGDTLTTLVAYDQRLLEAGKDAGLATAAPGTGAQAPNSAPN